MHSINASHKVYHCRIWICKSHSSKSQDSPNIDILLTKPGNEINFRRDLPVFICSADEAGWGGWLAGVPTPRSEMKLITLNKQAKRKPLLYSFAYIVDDLKLYQATLKDSKVHTARKAVADLIFFKINILEFCFCKQLIWRQQKNQHLRLYKNVKRVNLSCLW